MGHMAELRKSLSSSPHKIFPLYYSGPDHRLTYIVSLIALFRVLDLDHLCAARTAPCHSWRNPVERVMSTFNLGLQCVRLMRESMDREFESQAAKCGSLSDMRAKAVKCLEFRTTTIDDSISHV